MRDLYISVLEVTKDTVTEIFNQKVNTGVLYSANGFEFNILYAGTDYFQMTAYVRSQKDRLQMDAVIETAGIRLGGKYDIPFIVSPEDVFIDYVCFINCREPYSWKKLQSMGVRNNWNLFSNDFLDFREKSEKMERVTGFSELMDYIDRDDELHRCTETMVNHTRVYDESFFSDKLNGHFNMTKLTLVSFQENFMLLAAEEAAARGRHTAILSFTNPVSPGGGVTRGAKSQEASSCRSTNLYKSITSQNAYAYYQSNQCIQKKNQFDSMFLGTDKVIYSPNVMVLKNTIQFIKGDMNVSKELYLKHPFCLDVITCAAPFFKESKHLILDGDLQHIFMRRIQNIFEAAIDNEVEVLVLGAFGCGAFNNPPQIVADAFREVLLQTRYRKAFEEVIFAIKKSTNRSSLNFQAFERNFSSFPLLNN